MSGTILSSLKILISSAIKSYEEDIVILTVMARKLRHREVVVSGHIARRSHS